MKMVTDVQVLQRAPTDSHFEFEFFQLFQLLRTASSVALKEAKAMLENLIKAVEVKIEVREGKGGLRTWEGAFHTAEAQTGHRHEAHVGVMR